MKFHTPVLITLSIFFGCLSCKNTAEINGPYFANGIKIGEVTQNKAIIWVRLTKDSVRVNEKVLPEITYLNPETGAWDVRDGRKDREVRVIYPEGYTINKIEGAVPGAPGFARVKYKSNNSLWTATSWQPVDSLKDYTCQVELNNLDPDNTYEIIVESRGPQENQVSETISGEFKTAPEITQPSPVRFMVSTGQAYNDLDSTYFGFKLYNSILKLNPSFFVHTGDIVYYDSYAKNVALAQWHWQRTYSLPSNIEFQRHVSSYFIKDDHDTWMNDCWPGQSTRFMGDFTFEQGIEIFKYEVPMKEKTYRTVRWGKDLQLWFVEGRDFRSPNTMEDGPAKTIWGKEQLTWFKQSVEASDATFRILVSPTPIVGPDRLRKNDNHANIGFSYEGDMIRRFISNQKNMYIICGDRHWQYFSIHEETGLKEFCCGPASDEHAGGWSNDQRMPSHQYLNVIGGFLTVEVKRISNNPQISFTHHGVDGAVFNAYIEESE